MRLTSRIHARVGILLTATILAAADGTGRAAGLMSAAPRALPSQTGTVRQSASPAETDALRELQKRLDGYLHLRSDLAHRLKPLSPTADAAELTARQESLASAIRIARKDAQKGDLIPSAAASRIRTIVVEDLKSRPPEARRAAFSEVPEGVVVAVNKTYPAQAALPTVPPLLLNKLPTLPDNLQYRFVGRDVVLLDADTQLIVDYIENVLPPH